MLVAARTSHNAFGVCGAGGFAHRCAGDVLNITPFNSGFSV